MAKVNNKKNISKPKENKGVKTNKSVNLKSAKKNNLNIFLLLLCISIVTFIAYYPALDNKFTNWDDGGYIIENIQLKDFNLEGIKTQFSQYFMGNYHPLNMISLSADYAIAQMNPRQYHLTNIILHLINTMLVFWLSLLIFTKLKKELITTNKLVVAGIVGVLFGVHTMNTESVAWISERKNLLYTLFFVASLISYLQYIKTDKLKFYFLSIFLFLLSLFSKGTAVSLAITVIVADYFFERKLFSWKVIAEKLPFLSFALLFGIIAILAQKTSNTIQSNADYHFYERFLIGGYGLFEYIIKLILPINLSFFYQYPVKIDGVLPLQYYLYPIISVAILVFTFIYFKRSRIVMFCVAFFIVNIILVLQIIPVGYAVMADRYVYIPSIGFFIIIASIYNYLVIKKPKLNVIFLGVILVYVISLVIMTQQRSKTWYDGFSLWNAEIEQNPNSALAYKNRGKMKSDVNDFKGSFDDYNKAVMINPKYGEAYNGRGMAKAKLNDLTGALDDFNKAIALYPNDQLAWNNRGIVKSMTKDYKGAIYDFTKAIALDKNLYKAYTNRAVAKQELGDYKGAIEDLTISLGINPYQKEIWNYRGRAKFLNKDYDGAVKDLSKAIEFNPNNGEIYFNRAIAKYSINDKQGACNDWKLSLNFGFAQANGMINKYCK